MNPRGVSVDDGKTNACPECDDTSLTIRPGSFENGKLATRWKCRTCNAEFDEPNRRVPKSSTKPKGLAGRLADANPEDVGL